MPLSGEYAPGAREQSRVQAEAFEESGGAESAELRGRPIVVVTSVGARTGKLRKTPLMRVEHDGTYAVVASQGGAPTHPVWHRNLVRNPHVELQAGAEKHDYTAHEAEGEEYRTWWDRAVAAWPDYAEYPTRTSRRIPVFVLERASEG